MSSSKPSTKNIPINKYSTYELKSGIDQMIVKYLERIKFTEYQKYSNMKIFVGLLVLSFTALAYLYPKPFPENYNAILIGVIGYVIFSTIYWFLEEFYIKDIFYYGSNVVYCQNIRLKKHCKIQEITIRSKVPLGTANYNFHFDFQTEEGIVKSPENTIACDKVVDERGYVVREEVEKYFVDIFHKELLKIR